VGREISRGPEFKYKVALEALGGKLTVSELAAKYDIDPALIEEWKNRVREKLEDAFPGKGLNSGEDLKVQDSKDAFAKIGQFTLDREFFRKLFDL
jgi:transposase-like protein